MWWNISWIESHDDNGYNGGLFRMDEILGKSLNIGEFMLKVVLFFGEIP